MELREDMAEKVFSVLPRGRVGRPWGYGYSEYGFTNYGEDAILFVRSEYGNRAYGGDEYGDYVVVSGVYWKSYKNGRRGIFREEYRVGRNPRTVAQQAQRAKMGDAVTAWQALTDEQKEPYRHRARAREMSGYNLFLREYLQTH